MSQDIINLEENQRLACSTIEGPVLILAGAGTGKTATVVARIGKMLEAGIREILAVTFTNKAANEMRERVSRITEETGGLWMGTFHGISARLLRIYYAQAGLQKDFVILSEDEKKRVIKRVCEALEIDENRYPIKLINFVLSEVKNSGIINADDERLVSYKYKDLDIVSIYKAYQERLAGLNAVDFDDLISITFNLMVSNKEILSDIQDRFRYIMVDEYQDTNKLQHLWINIIASKYQNICCVGDEDQSIYGWRGAEIKYILNFSNEFPGAKIIKLEKNYRSTSEIVKCASSLIQNNQQRYGKTIFSEVGGLKPVVKFVHNDKQEGLDIAKEILNFKKQGIRFDKMAILVRASYQMRMIEEALMQFKVPYRVIDGLKFYDRKEIKDLIAYLRFIYLQNDYLSFERIIACPKRGVGEKTVEKIIDNAQIMQMPILETIEDMADAGYFKGRADAMRDFCRCCKKIRNLIFENRKLDAIVESIYIESGYAQMLQDSVAENPQESGRVDNVREFIASLAQFDSIGQFLEHVALLSATDDKIIEDSVNLMTIHGSKGLEFDVVILPGLEDGTMPSARSIEESKSGAEEERRLFYVAITRAKVHLLMYTAEIRMTFGKLANCIPSRFLKEIKDHVEFKRVRGEF
jgi:DNA helicase-2/ATP-dependent DNA helicase PcrA